jgi:hypothetical protein
MLSVCMLNVIILSVLVLSVIIWYYMVNVIILSVVAPLELVLECFCGYNGRGSTVNRALDGSTYLS